MKRSIIYVFGPKRLSNKYFDNSTMNLDEGGWLKIGQTSTEDDSLSKWDCALNRINGETHTGIPEKCLIYDVFEYPYRKGNNDDILRNILTEDIYCLENSKLHNKDLEQYEIKAGQEFVYGVSRDQVQKARKQYEYNLILDYYNENNKLDDELMKFICKNNEDGEESFVSNNNEPSLADKISKSEWRNNLWNRVAEKLSTSNFKIKINIPKEKPYIGFKSPSNSQLYYILSYSTRQWTTSISIETYSGKESKEAIEKYIVDNDINSKINDLKLKQGVKDKNKWAWSISDTLDKTDDELIDWFVNTALSFLNSFENKIF